MSGWEPDAVYINCCEEGGTVAEAVTRDKQGNISTKREKNGRTELKSSHRKNKGDESYELKNMKRDPLVGVNCVDAFKPEQSSQGEDVPHKEETILLSNDAEDDDYSEAKMGEVQNRSATDINIETGTKGGFSWRKMNRKQIMILLSINFTYLLARLNYSLSAPFFPKEANEKGVNATITGWIFGVFALVQFIVSPFYRHLLLRLGCRTLLILGLCLCGISNICFGLLTYIDTTNSIVLFVALCLVARMMLAVSCTLIDNTGLVMLVQYFPENVATFMGIGEVFTGIGYVSGPALGGFLYASGGYMLPFTVAGGIAMLALPFYWYFVPKENVALKVGGTDLPLLDLLLHPVSLVNSIVIVLIAISWSVLDPTLEPHLREHGIPPETVGIMFVVLAAFYSVTSPIWGRIADLILEKRILNITGTLLSALGFLWIGPSPVFGLSMKYNYVWYTAISLGIIGTTSGMCVISTYSIYINVIRAIGFPENNKSYGMVSGLWVSMFSLGYFIGPCLGGFLFDHIGFDWLVTCVAVVCLLTCLLVCLSLLVERNCCRKRYFRCAPPSGIEDSNVPAISDNAIELITSQNFLK